MRILLFLGLVAAGLTVRAGEKAADDAARCEFGGIAYFHRWTEKDQHEYTPKGQEDLERWSDMVTINLHRAAKDGDGLASVANAVLENYKGAGGRVLRTNSKPRTDTAPAEHLVVVILPQPTMIEIAFARFVLVDGMGCVVVYSHREYGEKIGPRVSAWLQENGPKIEPQLMEWKTFPTPTALTALSAQRQSTPKPAGEPAPSAR